MNPMTRPLRLFAGLAICQAAFAAANVLAAPVTILFGDRSTRVEALSSGPDTLRLDAADLERATGFVVKPEGACLGEICIPLTGGIEGPATADGKATVDLAKMAAKIGWTFATDMEERVWSFATIPARLGGPLGTVVAPDFELADMDGRKHRLSDYRGKKVLLLTWASWCACNLDLPNWEKLQTELRDRNFVILAAAQDSGGAEAARKWYDRANPTFVALVDPMHVVSTLYNLVNVPMGVWIDEKGNMVRPPEVAYTSRTRLGAVVDVPGEEYVKGLRDWVEKGEKSAYALDEDELLARLHPRDKSQDLADATFRLGVHFRGKDDARAERYWTEAQALRPDSWNYHRQDWSFTPEVAMKNWMAKVRTLEGKPYYEPLDLAPEGGE